MTAILSRIALKGYKVYKELSEETTAYSTKITLDGKVIGDARNDGQGGCDRIHIDRNAQAEWNATVEAWANASSLGHKTPDAEDLFISDLAKIIAEKKIAARQFKRDPRTTVVVAVDVEPETIGDIKFYNATVFHVFAAVTDERIDANMAEQYDGNPVRKYTRGDL